MHIGFRTSGGRGEYEVVGSHSGYAALDLEGWTFSIRWPDGVVRDTGLWLDPAESGKPRLRSMLDKPFQIGRAVAAMLLLPDPRRTLAGTGSDADIVLAKGYVLTRLGFGPGTEFDPVTDLVTIEPSFVSVTNRLETESIGVEKRWARVTSAYAGGDQLAPSVRTELERHRAFLASGQPVGQDLTRNVNQLIRSMTDAYSSYVKGTDPLIYLEQVARIVPSAGPSLPPPDELGEDEPEVSARAAHQYRLAKVRGPAHRAFSISVRQAYRHRCAFCGGAYGGVPGIRSGLEAAHILAWSKYDLDELRNGMSLCKTHHWAFDAGLVVPEYQAGNYRLRFTTLSEQFEQESMRLLGTDGLELPEEWFPADASLRPSQQYLSILYEDLGITFVA